MTHATRFVAVAVLVALAGTRLLEGMLFGVRSADPTIYLTMAYGGEAIRLLRGGRVGPIVDLTLTGWSNVSYRPLRARAPSPPAATTVQFRLRRRTAGNQVRQRQFLSQIWHSARAVGAAEA